MTAATIPLDELQASPGSDRMTTALLLALLLHAAVLLGLGFSFKTPEPVPQDDTLDVVLVNWRSEEAPEQADFLAQADQIGGGDSDEAVRPVEEQSSLVPNPDPGDATQSTPMTAPAPATEQRELLATEEAEQSLPEEDMSEEAEEVPLPSAEELLRQNQELAQIQPEVRPDTELQARSPRKKYISANTRQYEYASYMQAWVAKVERIGNLNYPSAARSRNLVGDLILTVGIHADGTLESIQVMRSSGYPVLDEAAREIVHIAAPFAPLSEDITRETDVLYITRTWRFSQGNRLATER